MTDSTESKGSHDQAGDHQDQGSASDLLPSHSSMSHPTEAELRIVRPGRVRQGRWSRLCLKELRETLRDRRTLVTLFLMPLLVYPLLSMVFQRTLVSTWQRPQQPEILIGVTSKPFLADLERALEESHRYLEGQRRNERQNDSDSESLDAQNNPIVKLFVVPDVAEQVKRERVDIGVEPAEEPGGRIRVHYRDGSALSERGLDYLRQHLQCANEQILRAQLRQAGSSANLPFLLALKGHPTRPTNTTLATLIPMILILMTVTGAVYPSIDLTAGERERGTLEMLMAAPVSKLRLLLAKYVAVVTVAFLTALVNLGAMLITLQLGGLSKVIFGEQGIGMVRIGQILALLILFASFFSAVLLALTSFARSFKEAQAYLIPLMLLSLGPGVVSLLPGLELQGPMAITPVSNMVLLARDLCAGGVNPTMAAVVVVSTILYTLAAIGIAAKLFGADAVLNSSADWSDLWGQKTPSGVSSVQGALFCLALLFPIYFVVANSASHLVQFSMLLRLVVTGIATASLFGLFPTIVARVQRLNFRSTFVLTRPPIVACLIAIVWGTTLWPLAHELAVITYRLGFAELHPEQFAVAEKMLSEWRTEGISLAWIVLAMGIAPGVCEEWFFRGYMGSALRGAMSPWRSITVTALLFGVFHVVSSQALSIERFLPSTFLGLALGWLCDRSKSLWPGVILHASHNSLLLIMTYYKSELERLLAWDSSSQEHLPRTWLLGSVLSLVLGGMILIMWGSKRELTFRSPPIDSTFPENEP